MVLHAQANDQLNISDEERCPAFWNRDASHRQSGRELGYPRVDRKTGGPRRGSMEGPKLKASGAGSMNSPCVREQGVHGRSSATDCGRMTALRKAGVESGHDRCEAS